MIAIAVRVSGQLNTVANIEQVSVQREWPMVPCAIWQP